VKSAESLRTNEDASTSGENNVYPDLVGREHSELDLSWGEKKHEERHFGLGALEASKESREKMLDRLFSHEAHSRPLARKTAAAHVPPAPTLVEQVLSVVGHR
jgi:hypothetical protein